MDVAKEGFGCTYEDYHEGRYWARDWVAGGAKRNELQAEFHALTVYRNNYSTLKQRYNVVLNFLTPVISDQAAGHGEVRTRGSVLDGLFINARYVLDYLKNSYEYKVTNSNGTSLLPLNKDHAEYLVTEGVYNSAVQVRPIDAAIPALEQAVVTQNTFADFGLSDYMSVYVELEGFGCPTNKPDAQFYTLPEYAQGITASELND